MFTYYSHNFLIFVKHVCTSWGKTPNWYCIVLSWYLWNKNGMRVTGHFDTGHFDTSVFTWGVNSFMSLAKQRRICTQNIFVVLYTWSWLKNEEYNFTQICFCCSGANYTWGEHHFCAFMLLEFVSKRLSIETTDFQTDIACSCWVALVSLEKRFLLAG